MKTTRREFLKAGTLVFGAAAFLPGISCNPSKKGQAGKPELVTALQLYSVREDMKTDPEGTLKKLAEMGWTHMEHANYVDHKFYGWTAAEFKNVIDGLGLKMPSGHTVLGKNHWDEALQDFTDDWKKLVDDAAFMGQQYVVSPWLDPAMYADLDTLLKYMEVFNKCGELCKKAGMRFGYHNHDFEFSRKIGEEMLFDLIMQHTDKDKVVLQLDTGNMYTAGALAKDILAKYPGRYDNIHIKDMVQKEGGEGFESTIVGKGVLPIREITDMARDQGTTLFIVEQESYQGLAPLDCMKENLAVLKEWGY
jgi:sugar phosphate isomerase/epimerase